MSYSWDQIIAWLGLVIPLMALAWSAIHFVRNQAREQRFREFQKFRELMSQLGQPNNGVLGQMAVAFELRKFPEYREVIVRALESTSEKGALQGEGASLLGSEFALTIEALRKK